LFWSTTANHVFAQNLIDIQHNQLGRWWNWCIILILFGRPPHHHPHTLRPAAASSSYSPAGRRNIIIAASSSSYSPAGRRIIIIRSGGRFIIIRSGHIIIIIHSAPATSSSRSSAPLLPHHHQDHPLCSGRRIIIIRTGHRSYLQNHPLRSAPLRPPPDHQG
jgi:hypothetical protein